MSPPLSCDFTAAERGAIALGFNDIEAVSCARFRPATTADTDWVVIDNKESGCFAHLGYYGPHLYSWGAHQINLARGYYYSDGGWRLWTCATRGTVIHEALHIMGVQHEQCRPDRDEYIDIHWEKMQVSIMVMQST